MKKSWLILSWMGATALVSFITFQGLSAAQGGVNDSPLTPVVVATTVVASADATTTVVQLEPRPSDSTSTTTGGGTSVGQAASQSGGTTGLGTVSTTSTTTAGGGNTTSTTVANTTSTTVQTTTSTTTDNTTTTTSAEWVTTTITSPGGSVTVSYRTGEVRYDAAAPAAGYTMDVKETGPEVRVEFEASDGDLADYDIRARWTSGGFDSEVNEKG